MFDIEYKGGNTVVVNTKKVSVVSDPRQSLVGLKDIVSKDAIELATEDRFAVRDSAYRLVIDGPGEYEVADVSIRAVPASRHIDAPDTPQASTIYQLEIGDVRLALLGNIGPELSDLQLESIGVVDSVIIPVGGGGYTLDATSAAKIVRQIEPKIVIPVHYGDNALTYEVPQDTSDVFVNELGTPVETVPKLKVKNRASIPDSLTAVIIERS